MTTQVLPVAVGVPQRVTVGDNTSFYAQPGALGTILLEYSQDGINFTQFALSGLGVGVVLNAKTLGLGQFAVVRATAATAAGVLVAADLNPGGLRYMTGGAVILQEAVSIATPAVTTEGNVIGMRFPAGYFKPNWSIDIDLMFSCVNTANVKTVRAYFGNTALGTLFWSGVLTSSTGGRASLRLAGRNDNVSVIGSSPGAALGFGISTTAPIVISSNAALSAETELLITCQKATGAEVLTLDSALVKLYQ